MDAIEAKKLILVVDDDVEMVGNLRSRLEHVGYRTQAAHEGVRAIEMAHKFHPNLILLDIMMPAGDGHTVLKRLRAHWETENIPVIVLTAIRDRKVSSLVLKEGASGFFEKPYEMDELLQKIQNLI